MKRLFRVICRGMQDSHGIAYVIAEDATAAYDCVRDDLNQRSLGFYDERAMERVELIAEDCQYPESKRRLYEVRR